MAKHEIKPDLKFKLGSTSFFEKVLEWDVLKDKMIDYADLQLCLLPKPATY
jgi:hypothetical protein